jgi:acyl carrier protein
MTFDDWAAATKPKVDGAWNFHNHLQHKQMDFFIMLSSTAYRVGNRTQAAYSAAGGFLEGLAHHRRGLGLKADAIELELVEDEGVFAQNKEKLKHLLLTMVQICVDSDQIIALCKAAILNQLHPVALIGARVQPPELKTFYWMHNPHFVHIKAKVANQIGDGTGDNTPDEKLSVSLGKAGSKEEKASLIRAAVISRFAVLLMVPRAEIPTDKSFFDLGIDSLVAVEVRTWVWQEIGVHVVSRDIFGAPSVDAFVVQITESLAAAGTSS